MTLVAAFTYPWDVIGDPQAASRLRDLGADTVILAAAYHSTIAITPRHPRHRVVQARYSAVYYPPDPARWGSAALRPAGQQWCAAPDAYGQAAAILGAAGLAVHAWVVLTHNSRLAQAFPRHAVRNAYGDRYGWALCAAQPEVADYAAALAAEAAAQPGTSGVELESCGWYGHAHLHAHDKTGGVPFGAAGSYLLSLCFCPACRDGYAARGADPGQLAAAVRQALEPMWRGEPADGPGWAAVQGLLGADLAAATLAHRCAAALRLQRAVIAAVREQAGQRCRIVLHAELAPHATGASPGVVPGDLFSPAAPVRPDGLVVPAGLAAAAPAAGVPLPPAAVLAANCQVVSGMGGDPDFTPPRQATEIRLYHPGLASEADLRAAAVAVARFRAARGRPAAG